VPATTLDVVASATPATARAGKRLLVALDSKRAEPYLQMFDAQLASLGPPLSMTPAAFAAAVPAGDPIAVVGDAAVPLMDALSRAGIPASLLDGPSRPDAAVLAVLAASQEPMSGAIRPFYLHPPAVKAPASGRGGA
jgi:tRNA threonylcarbamoyladenosine biosynthesis protein TsaB